MTPPTKVLELAKQAFKEGKVTTPKVLEWKERDTGEIVIIFENGQKIVFAKSDGEPAPPRRASSLAAASTEKVLEPEPTPAQSARSKSHKKGE